MATHDVIVIGASAGGVEAISQLVGHLPADLPAAVLVVLHVARGRSVLPEILTRVGQLPARHPFDGETLLHGRIYVAPPNHHMIVEDGVLRLHHGPTKNGVRPAVDPLFRSAARAFGARTVGVVLTGSLDDGTAGLAAISEAGGVTIVQDPAEAFAPSMPRSALEFVDVDHVLPLRAIAALLPQLAHRTAHRPSTAGPQVRAKEADLGSDGVAVESNDRPGRPSVFTCPECNGTLWETEEKGILRFRCRVGHAYSSDSMLAAQTYSVDHALWAALRALEERAVLNKKMSDRAGERRHTWVARAFADRARIAAEHAAVVRGVLQNRSAAQIVPNHADAAELVDPGMTPERPHPEQSDRELSSTPQDASENTQHQRS